MTPMPWWIVCIMVVIGHLGLHVAIYNRVNGFGLHRKTIKRIEFFFLMTTILIPLAMWSVFSEVLWDVMQGRPEQLPIPAVLSFYSIACLLAWIGLGIPWLMWRPIFGLEWIDAPRQTEIVDVQKAVGRPLAQTIRCNLESRLPLNQIFELAIDQITFPVAGLPKQLDGYRIAHFSDVHLTGHVHPDFTHYVVQRATDWQPDLMAIAGDIIDSQQCVSWLGDLFGPASAADGCYFILGNHDKRIVDPDHTRAEMAKAGWIDVGTAPTERQIRGVNAMILGNEAPWFRPASIAAESTADFRLLLSHSPDQLTWARQHNVDLMLVGHTHGGQGRLPLAGPILSPSLHGSRYASGDFYKAPTTMHVSRGLCGTHLMRINCRPQLSLLTLKSL
ncbi:MAG: metallophosphoesterase [Pirellulaceae bacterium]|nr:metallophosphoesterase [Pirellulaceae bacterium]